MPKKKFKTKINNSNMINDSNMWLYLRAYLYFIQDEVMAVAGEGGEVLMYNITSTEQVEIVR